MSDTQSITSRALWAALVVLLLALAPTGTSRSQDNSEETQARQTPEQLEATPFVEKNLRQAVESSHMPEFDPGVGGPRSLVDQVRRTGQDAGLSSYPLPTEVPGHPSDPPGSLITREADIVAVGTVVDKHSFLTDHETDVFTEHQVSVSEVLKNDPQNPVQPGSTVYLVEAGGSISFEGHLIFHTYYGGVKALEKGQSYLLFLKRFPDLTDGYRGRAFLVEDGKLSACDGLKEFDEGYPLSKARRNVLAAAGAGGASTLRSSALSAPKAFSGAEP